MNMSPYQSFVSRVRAQIPGLYHAALANLAAAGYPTMMWLPGPQTGYAQLGETDSAQSAQSVADMIKSIADTYLQSRQTDKRLKYDAELQRLQIQLQQQQAQQPVLSSYNLGQWLPWLLGAGALMYVVKAK